MLQESQQSPSESQVLDSNELSFPKRSVVLDSFESLCGCKRIIIVGGSFDPPQRGHLELARFVGEVLSSDAVVLIPAAHNPLKRHQTRANGEERVAMLALALEGQPGFYVSPHEVRKGDKDSYTIDTLRDLRAAIGQSSEIFLVVGSDCLEGLPKWREIQEVLTLAQLIVVQRAGYKKPDFTRLKEILPHEKVEEIEKNCLASDIEAASSSEVRAQLAAGQSCGSKLLPAVADFIAEHGLYR